MAKRQLQKDLKKMRDDPPPGVSADLAGDNLFEWDALIAGPGDTPFEGGTFRLRLEYPKEYPNKPPTVFFFSRMFHPNVYPNGKICLDILEKPEMWKPVYDTAAVLCAIQSMLGDPNPDSPANGEANLMFMTDVKEYERRVYQIVALSEEDDGGINLNKEDETEMIESRLENLDLSGIQGDPQTLKAFLKR